MLGGEKYLLEQISGGDEKAFRAVFDHYYPKVLAFMGFFIRNNEDIQDVAQNVFAKIWIIRQSLPEIRSFEAYLYRLSRNAAIDYCRKHNILMPILPEFDFTEPALLDDYYYAKEARAQFDNSVNRMPDRRREVFTLSRTDGLSNEEIAKRLGISKKTVENHLNAALKELRKVIS